MRRLKSIQERLELRIYKQMLVLGIMIKTIKRIKKSDVQEADLARFKERLSDNERVMCHRKCWRFRIRVVNLGPGVPFCSYLLLVLLCFFVCVCVYASLYLSFPSPFSITYFYDY